MEIRKPAIIIAIIIILGGSLFAISSITGKAIEKDNTIKIGMNNAFDKNRVCFSGHRCCKSR